MREVICISHHKENKLTIIIRIIRIVRETTTHKKKLRNGLAINIFTKVGLRLLFWAIFIIAKYYKEKNLDTWKAYFLKTNTYNILHKVYFQCKWLLALHFLWINKPVFDMLNLCNDCKVIMWLFSTIFNGSFWAVFLNWMILNQEINQHLKQNESYKNRRMEWIYYIHSVIFIKRFGEKPVMSTQVEVKGF